MSNKEVCCDRSRAKADGDALREPAHALVEEKRTAVRDPRRSGGKRKCTCLLPLARSRSFPSSVGDDYRAVSKASVGSARDEGAAEAANKGPKTTQHFFRKS